MAFKIPDLVSAVKAAVTGLAEPASKIIDELHTGKIEKAEALARMQEVLNTVVIETERIGASVIIEEAKSQSWLARNWRPIGMMTFISIIPAIIIGSFLKIGGEYVSVTIATSLALVPAILWTIIGGGYAGYTALRSLVDKPVKAGTYEKLADALKKKRKT
jgi:hypothetical protein